MYTCMRALPPFDSLSPSFPSSFPPSPDKVATGILELIMDTSKVGTVMTVTNKRGIDYFTKLPGEKLGQSTKAKL